MSKNVIFVDQLCINSLFIFLPIKRQKIIVLNESTNFHRFYVACLKILGHEVIVADFFLGENSDSAGQSCYISSSNSARKLAILASVNILESNKLLSEINDSLKRNTLLLHLTKSLILYCKYWTNAIYISESLSHGQAFVLYLKCPRKIDKQIFIREFENINMVFYNADRYNPIYFLKEIIQLLLNVIKYWLYPFNGLFSNNGIFVRKKQIAQNTTVPSILMIQEDTLSLDNSKRGQPHWFDFSTVNPQFNTYIIKNRSYSLNSDQEVISKLNNYNIIVEDLISFRSGYLKMKNHKSIIKLKKYRWKVIKEVCFNSRLADKHILMQTAFFIKQAEFIAAVCLWLNAKIFLFRESHYTYTDAVQIVSADLSVTTVAYQYSNLALVSPMMINTADYMLLFSNSFRNIFSNKFFKPANFLEMGYVYDTISPIVKERALKIRNELIASGVNLIITYFDESVQNDKWGLVKKSDHLRDLEFLAKRVLEDTSFAIILKTQFKRNSPLILFPGSFLINNAINTGRFIVLESGSGGTLRNDVFPAESAMISDLTIGHKIGATASLESVYFGVKSVLIDEYSMKTEFDHLYLDKKIVFKNLQSLFKILDEYRNTDKFNEIGNWDTIIANFVSKSDISSSETMRKFLLETMNLS